MARPSVYFATLGCAKNEVDTRHMQEALLQDGFAISDDAEGCDAIVVNTCSFIRPAIEESIDAIFELAGIEGAHGGGVPVVVAGCLPARFGDDLASELVEAAAFVPCADEGDIASVVRGCLGLAPSACADDRTGSRGAAPKRQQAAAFAYVKISDGCDRFCSYCTIPYIRGRYHSFSFEEVLRDVRSAVDAGVREVVLIGQDTGLWGSDLSETDSLATLLGRLADLFPDTWFRAMYTQPENVTDELLEAMAAHDNVAPYLDIPLQHCVGRILAAMNRTGSRDGFMRMLEEARCAVPGLAVRTTLIAGFPGETEDDFEELVSFVEDAEFDYVGVFPYSREEGTAAFSLDGQVDEDEKAYRAERLRTVADAVSASVVSRRVGHACRVLVEGVEEDGQLFGRSIVQAPEVDGVTFLDAGRPGSIVEAVVEDTLMYDMEAVRNGRR